MHRLALITEMIFLGQWFECQLVSVLLVTLCYIPSLHPAADPGADPGGKGWAPWGPSKHEMGKFTALSTRSYSNAVYISI